MLSLIFRTWTDEKIAQLKTLWWDGVGAIEICMMLGASSPRAVSEKAQKMGFKRNPMLKRYRSEDVYAIPELAIPHVREDGTLVTMETVGSKECRYIFDTPGGCESPMCGRKTVGGPWCPDHRKRVFVKSAAVA